MKMTVASRKWKDIIWHNYNCWYSNNVEYYARQELQEWLYANLAYDSYDGYILKENNYAKR